MNDDLYNQAIITAARDRSHAGVLEKADASATADNPLCGDRVRIDIEAGAAGDDRLAAVVHKTRGCLLTQAAAALLAAHAEQAHAGEAAGLRRAIRDYLEGRSNTPALPELAILEPVRAVRSRHDCVTIAFDALAEAVAALPEEKRR